MRPGTRRSIEAWLSGDFGSRTAVGVERIFEQCLFFWPLLGNCEGHSTRLQPLEIEEGRYTARLEEWEVCEKICRRNRKKEML